MFDKEMATYELYSKDINYQLPSEKLKKTKIFITRIPDTHSYSYLALCERN